MGRFRQAVIGACAAAALLAFPAAAQASLSWNPSVHNFGSQQVGFNKTQGFVLVARCDADTGGAPPCTSPPGGAHNFGAPTVSGKGFSLLDNGCASGTLSTPGFANTVASCQVSVKFAPTSNGPTQGEITLPDGPDVALSGTGFGAPSSSKKPKKCKKRAAAAKKKKCKRKGK
jgi:hypothetical protein